MKNLLRCLSLALFLSIPTLAQQTWNARSPGQRFEILDNLRREGETVVVFSSQQSDECRRFIEQLKPLQRELDINFLQVDRPTADDIDWKSPLARQYNLRELPYVIMYEGRDRVKEGHEARKALLTILDSLTD